MEERDRFPLPDPSILTTQALHRELLALRELMETRLDGMDKAVDVIQAQANKSPTIGELQAKYEEKFAGMKSLSDERLKGIELRFEERDIRFERSDRDNKVALEAALAAAKEAVGEQNKSSALAINKSELATAKQIDQLGTTMHTIEKSLSDKVGDNKERLNRVEGNMSRIEGNKQGGDAVWGYLVGAAGLLIALASVLLRATGH